jgi:hypothetical protein
MLWALFGSPRLLLPASLWERLTPDQRDTLLVHELAHLRRGDHWVRWLELAALALYWWHPVAWWARRQLQEAEEQCCDAWVVWALPDAALAYADALVATVAFLSQPRLLLPLGASGMGRTSQVKRRLTMIVNQTGSRALSWPWLLLVLLLGAALLPWRPTWAELTVLDDRDQPPVVVLADDEPQPELPPQKSKSKPQIALPKMPAADNAAPMGAQNPRLRGSSVSREEIENAKDEVELMEAQLAGRQAELREMDVRIATARTRNAQLRQLREKGVAPESELIKAHEDVDVLAAQRSSKQALVKEAEIRLRQARRRLEALQPNSPPPARQSVPVVEGEKPKADPKPAKDYEARERRVQELERLVEKVLQEIGELRNEMKGHRR